MKTNSLACTHIGRRNNNEDAFCVAQPVGLFAVADGMGGYEGGEVASRLAIESLSRFIERNAADDDITWPYAADKLKSPTENMLAIGARLAHDQITLRRSGPLAQMGSTLVAMIVRDHRAVIVHVGDSRAYRLRNGRLVQVTRDHSFYEELIASGTTNLPDRDDFPHRNMITRALGISGPPEVQTCDIAPGDLFLLCSDGLTDPLGDDELEQLLGDRGVNACEPLVQRAYAAGGQDNITAVVIECG